MRDVVTLFIEASVAKGEWKAALSALQPLRASGGSSASAGSAAAAIEAASNIFHLSSTLSKKGEWSAALAVLRSAPSPTSVRGRTQYSSVYLAARVRAYHHVLEARCSCTMAAVVESATADTSSGAPAVDVNANAEEMSFESALGLAREAFSLSDSASELCRWSRTPCGGGTIEENIPESPLAPVEGHSAGSETGTDCVEALLRWCRSELPRRCSLTGVAMKEQTETALQELTELSAVALRGISDVYIDVSHNTSKKTQMNTASGCELDPQYPQAASDVQRAEAELWKLLASNSRATDSWATSLSLLQQIPAERVTGHLFTALLRHLLQHYRQNEIDRLVCTLVLLKTFDDSAQQSSQALTRTLPSCDTARALRADSVVIKVVAEACHRLRRADLAAALLLDTEARASMTPSAAVPLVMTLRDAGASLSVLIWWELLRQEKSALRYPLLQHAKLSSYVASCVLRSTAARSSEVAPKAAKETRLGSAACRAGDWQKALDAFRDAAAPAHDPALVLLFELRLLRQAGQWRAAVQLFNAFCQTHPYVRNSEQPSSTFANQRHDGRRNDGRRWCTGRGAPETHPGEVRGSAMMSACAVLTMEHAEQWIPPDVLAHLRRQVESLKSGTVGSEGEAESPS
ncbi:hypothetical protein JKF63_02174 [Porcisia hertigi]|uniref:Uncharacterized protein n=1 Tax=Porcisia hertigi TaxID=2761500 RepID=A0A836HL30_9TRYP|nr:hypothetical protein JKF63_02174 [Porcisia hertigi]